MRVSVACRAVDVRDVHRSLADRELELLTFEHGTRHIRFTAIVQTRTIGVEISVDASGRWSWTGEIAEICDCGEGRCDTYDLALVEIELWARRAF
jgi:hypothetical protein